MSHSAVAKRYALALFQLGKEHQLLDQMEQEMRVVKEAVLGAPGLIDLLKSPKLSIEKKKDVISRSFANASVYVLNTLMILVERHRVDLISEVAERFIGFSYQEKGIAEAKVYSVRPLTAEESSAVSAAFAKKAGKKSLLIDNIVDPDLLGGIKVRIGNTIYDGSLRGKLDRLERQLLG